MNNLRVVLTEEDFVKLIEGKQVDKEGKQAEVSIILQDIGFYRMKELLDLVSQK